MKRRVNKVTIDQVKFEANWDKIKIIGGEMDYDYMTAVHSAMIDQDVINRQKDLNIVYSAMHGTGRDLPLQKGSPHLGKP